MGEAVRSIEEEHMNPQDATTLERVFVNDWSDNLVGVADSATEGPS